MRLPQTVFRLIVAMLATTPAIAQDHASDMQHNPMGAATSSRSPYAGQETRAVKALSDQQIADLRAGRGMGLARAAELNGYPGPVHVLELADALQLSDQQRAQAKALFEAMRQETVPIGERIIAEETALDHLFAEKRITPSSLDEAISKIGSDEGFLRAAHLRYHLAMAQVLSAAQIARYNELRGYAESAHHDHRMQ